MMQCKNDNHHNARSDATGSRGGLDTSMVQHLLTAWKPTLSTGLSMGIGPLAYLGSRLRISRIFIDIAFIEAPKGHHGIIV